MSVAILDTGIDRNHPAFAGMAITELDFSGDGDGDVNGHGTHCAGTVFGRDVDGQRIGVARGVSTALIGKVLGDQGGGGSEMLFNGMEWAIRNNAQVLSMSLGFDFPGLAANLISQGWPEALATSAALEGYRMNLRMFDRLLAMLEARAAFNGGTVVVAASGNESRRPQFELSASVPAAALGVLSVGALGEGPSGFTVASFSKHQPGAGRSGGECGVRRHGRGAHGPQRHEHGGAPRGRRGGPVVAGDPRARRAGERRCGAGPPAGHGQPRWPRPGSRRARPRRRHGAGPVGITRAARCRWHARSCPNSPG